ncbi:hypothetical protein VIGAN_09043800 [Vigna angularis var. angularis]|uniref:Uncharacterized protein n=2 Tax=Phaseolus angularis TaxID=3914 RepID=A0A0S3SW51_PHAAN|nr:hypothetical protein VIGAN_09043800 [Vigna angularis var. angularis]
MKICQQMDCDKTIELHILPEKEGWILFQKYAGLSDNSSKSILDRGRKISKECKGLPIAIAFIARSLKGPRPLEEWDVALTSLQKSMHVNDNEDESRKKVYTCLKYSYDNMKDETAKKLFLLCSLFREDEEISEELLVRLAKGATLIDKIDDDDSYDECRKKVIVAKNKLIDSCLLLNCKYERVKMHDLVREMALWIANEENVAVNTSKKNEMTKVEKGKDIKYLLCEGKIKNLFSSKFDGSKLVILIVYMKTHHHVEVPNSFFENKPGLQVLILSNSFVPRPSLSLPQSIQRLTNIKSLYLKRFKLGNISIIGNLQALETLELV